MPTSPDHPVGTVQRGEKRAATDAAAADEQDDESALQLLRELLPALRSGYMYRNSLSAADKFELILAEWSKAVAAHDGGALYTPRLSPHGAAVRSNNRKLFFKQGKMPGLISFLSDAPEGQQPALFSLARQLMSGAGRAALIKMYGTECAEDEAEAEPSVAQFLMILK